MPTVPPRKLGIPLAAGVLLAASVTACAQTSSVSVDIGADQWTVTPEVIEPSEVEFSVINNDDESHQPVVIRALGVPPDSLPTLDGFVDLTGMSMQWPQSGEFGEFDPLDSDLVQSLNETNNLEPGQTVTGAWAKTGVVVGEDIEPGTYVILCFLPGHYERGEFTVFEVQG